jgi:hypothetical protein
MESAEPVGTAVAGVRSRLSGFSGPRRRNTFFQEETVVIRKNLW